MPGWQMAPGAALSLWDSLGMHGLKPWGRNWFSKVCRKIFDSLITGKVKTLDKFVGRWQVEAQRLPWGGSQEL